MYILRDMYFKNCILKYDATNSAVLLAQLLHVTRSSQQSLGASRGLLPQERQNVTI